jgi:hypothetical protein
MCFCHTVAARYGALSGFGLSLAKWTLIVKHSTDLASRENSWLWWLIMAFGNVESLTLMLRGSQDSAVVIATGYRLDGRGVGVRVLAGPRFFSSPRCPDRLWGSPSFLSNWYRG